MKSRRVINAANLLDDARAGILKGAPLRRAITTCEEFGNKSVAAELRLYLVSSHSFAGDDAPEEIRDRVAKGISALVARGRTLTRTRQMLQRHGVIETINRIAKYPASSSNFELLKSEGLEHLTAEAIVVDYPEFFSPRALDISRKRLKR
jgi:hypothetical protein